MSSTPFVKTPCCFIDDCSLNISPIKSNSDNVETECRRKANTGVIVISSEGELSQKYRDEQNKSALHCVSIPKSKNHNEARQHDSVCNSKGEDIQQSKGKI